MHKLVIIKFSEQASNVIAHLAMKSVTSKPEASLLRAIDAKIELLKLNPFLGQKIPRRLIPPEYIPQGITNLYRLELPQFWRMLYNVSGGNVEILAFIMDILNHKSYSKKFGYG